MMTGLKGQIASLRRSGGFKKYSQNTFWLLGEKLFSMVFALFIGVWVTRYLGPENKGILAYALAFAAFVTPLSDLGVTVILNRNLVEGSGRENHKTLGTGFWLKLLGGILAFLILILVVNLWPQEREAGIIILILGSGYIFKSVYSVFESHLDALVKSKVHVKIKLITTFITGGLKVTAILLELSVVWFGLILLASEVLYMLGYTWAYYRQVGKLGTWRFDKSYAIDLLRDSWPNLLNGYATVMYMQADKVMINNMLGSYENGIYATALQLLSLWYFLPGVITRSLSPAIFKAFNEDIELFNQRIQVLMDVLYMIAVVIGITMLLFGNFIIIFLFGEEFAGAVPVLYIHIWSLLFIFLSGASGSWMLSKNLQRINFNRTMLGLVINVSLNFILIPRIGIMGAAYATLFAQMSASYLGFAISPKTREVFYMQTRSLFFISIYQNFRSGLYKKVLLGK